MWIYENKTRALTICFASVLGIIALGVAVYLLRPNVKMDRTQKAQDEEDMRVPSNPPLREETVSAPNIGITDEPTPIDSKSRDKRDGATENLILQNIHVASRIRATCKALDIQFPDDITTSKIAQRPPFRESMFQFSTSLGDVLGFDPIDGAFLWLMRHNLTEQSKSLGERAPLTAAEAAERLNEFGRAIGEPIQVSSEDAQYENNDSDNDASKDPDNGRWFFAGLQKYKDVPIFDSYFQADVSAVDGEILHYANRPLPPQEIDLTENVSEGDAHSHASDFINKMAQESGVEWQAGGIGKKVIVYPNNCWTGGEDTPLQRTGPPRCCWVERFEVGARRVLVFVDTITGEIIGGM